MPDELLQRLRRFHDDYFPGVADQFQNLVRDGQHPTTDEGSGGSVDAPA